jgi:choline-glycine betaine transporter
MRGMEEKPSTGVWMAVAVVTLLLLLIVAYVAGYFALSVRFTRDDGSTARLFRARWAFAIYLPAVFVESAVCGEPILSLR